MRARMWWVSQGVLATPRLGRGGVFNISLFLTLHSGRRLSHVVATALRYLSL